MKPTPRRLAPKLGWAFKGPPPKKKFHYCSGATRFVGRDEAKAVSDPYYMDAGITGSAKHLKKGTNEWEGDKEAGIPKMPPQDELGNTLIPREQLAKFMPDIYIDGLADEIMGNQRQLAKHIVPHKMRHTHDESMVTEGYVGTRPGADKSREHVWRANYALYQQRHFLADEMQRKMLIGNAEAQDRFQDADDVEYEAEVLAALEKADIDRAVEVYRRMADPPRNWDVYTQLLRHFASRGLLADALAVFDEMAAFKIPPSGEQLCALVDCAAAAAQPLRLSWAAAQARAVRHGRALPADEQARVTRRAVKALLALETPLADTLAVRAAAFLESGEAAGMEEAEAEAAALQARARELGIMPDAAPTCHAHRYAYGTPPTPGALEPTGQEPPAGPALLADRLTDAERQRLAEIAAEAAAADDAAPLAYFKKSTPNHPLQPGALFAFDYEAAGAGPLPCQVRDSGRTPSVQPSLARPMFRWNGPATRMMRVNAGAADDVPPTLEL